MSRLRKLIHLLGSAPYRLGLRHGVAAAIEHEDAIRSLPIGTLIDLGANKGQFSLVVRRWWPSATIHAVEPLVEPAATYTALFASAQGVTLHAFAVGSEPGQAAIHVSKRMDSSSLLPISDRQEEIFPGTLEVAQRMIEVVRGDDLLADAELPGPLLIKLDIQGFELAALQGMPKLLARADHVYTEVSFLPLYEGQALAHELTAFLTAAGFVFAGVHNVVSRSDGSAVQADLLFSRQLRT
ncbi:MAG: FkbM family methyltransferase [Brevundimonas sp.]|uniref:FkbM family methyltransferase n=1 Tax=Brevundimonas sp. TaxID=1871086 RepID=UPI00391BB821